MADSVLTAERALALDEKQGLPLLVNAMQKAMNCFEQWGLMKGSLQIHGQQLLDAGAMAIKPTGAGGGGYVLSLWREKPNANIPFELIPVL